MTTTPDTETDVETPQTPSELLAELAQLHVRTIVPPSPKHPSAFGWQAIAGCQAAGFARALHALMEVAPEKAAEITGWYQGPFEEGPDPEEHTDWIERTVAKDVDTLDAWIAEARDLAVKSAQATEAGDKERLAGQIEHDAIHRRFGLTYANYLVLHRTFLQSMPDEWQNRFVAVLDELDAAFAHVDKPEGFKVEAATEHEVCDLDDEQLAQLGITKDWYRGETPPEGLSPEDLAEWRDVHEDPNGPVYSRDGEEVDGGELVMLPAVDPVPHYNRGRARVEPRLGGGA